MNNADATEPQLLSLPLESLHNETSASMELPTFLCLLLASVAVSLQDDWRIAFLGPMEGSRYQFDLIAQRMDLEVLLQSHFQAFARTPTARLM